MLGMHFCHQSWSLHKPNRDNKTWSTELPPLKEELLKMKYCMMLVLVCCKVPIYIFSNHSVWFMNTKQSFQEIIFSILLQWKLVCSSAFGCCLSSKGHDAYSLFHHIFCTYQHNGFKLGIIFPPYLISLQTGHRVGINKLINGVMFMQFSWVDLFQDVQNMWHQ